MIREEKRQRAKISKGGREKDGRDGGNEKRE